MLKTAQAHINKIIQEVNRKQQVPFELKRAQNEIARLKRNLVYYEMQRTELKQALGLEHTSSYKELLEMAKDPANHKWQASSELITILAAAIKRMDEGVLYFTPEELEATNGQGIEAKWDTERNCAQVTVIRVNNKH